MAKAYWVAQVDVTEPEGYKAYMGADMAAFRKYGARFLVRGGQSQLLEGAVRSRTVVIEFPDLQAAVACYHSPEYQAAAALRKGRAVFDLVAIEGFEGEQP
jgi:uncharacterized protein (DUF1330 family)